MEKVETHTYILDIERVYTAKNSLQKKVVEFLKKTNRNIFRNRTEVWDYIFLLERTIEGFSSASKRCDPLKVVVSEAARKVYAEEDPKRNDIRLSVGELIVIRFIASKHEQD